MDDGRDDLESLLRELEVDQENTVKFALTSVYVNWTSTPDWPLRRVGFSVTLSGAVAGKDCASPIVANHPRGTVMLHNLEENGYGRDDQGQAIVGALDIGPDGEMTAHLMIPPTDLHAFVALLPAAVREGTPVQVWVRVFAGLGEWSGERPLGLARILIRVGEMVLNRMSYGT